MVRHRFEKIFVAILFTGLLIPYFNYKVFEVHQMIVACNQHIKDMFIPLWVSCLYGFIYIRYNKFT